MEQFPVMPQKKSSLNKIMAWIFGVVALVCIVFILIMVWLITQKTNVVIKQPSQTSQLSKTFTLNKLVFPQIVKLPSVTLKDIPADLQLLIINNSTQQVYNSIQYDNKTTGFQISYLVSTSTINKVMMQLLTQFNSAKDKSAWSMLGGGSTDSIGSFEFSKSGGDQIRVTLSKQGSDVRVMVQSSSGNGLLK